MKKEEIQEILEYWENGIEELPKNEVILFYPGARAVARKIDDFNIPIEVPSYLYEIIGLLSGGNFGFAQLIFIDILDYLSKNGPIEKGYKITAEDFKYTFVETGWPSWDDQDANSRYREKWFIQKSYNLPQSDNQIDYPNFWEKYFAR